MGRADEVQSMFAAIAGRYDLLNHLLSFGLDFGWWRQMARRSGAAPGCRYLDVAAGTGDSSVALARRGAEVVSSDFTWGMLRRGPAKFARKGLTTRIWASVGADALRLPFRDATFDGLTICYGLRNLERRDQAYREFLRVLRPGGTLTILEFSRPRFAWVRALYAFYSRQVLPRIGRAVSGDPGAYTYLPESIRAFPDPSALAAELVQAGWEEVAWEPLSGGIVALHTARRP